MQEKKGGNDEKRKGGERSKNENERTGLGKERKTWTGVRMA